ncbi:MAG: histidine kinase [Ignavibacteria bacterium GWA2_54_16]|nr:MAG: histidine kinase [Ignavibacteria bacterium GWA2_54_16]
MRVRLLNDRLENLIAVVQRLSAARTVGEVIDAVRSSARSVVSSDGATMVLREGDQCYYVDEDAIAPLWKGQRFPQTACISGWSMLHKETVSVPDIYTDSRVPLEAYRPTFVKSLAMVPIRRHDPIGAIGIYWAERHETGEEEVRILESLADATAIAFENVTSFGELENRVSQRTRELEAANKELEAFSYSVSHDLRAPLRAIDGFSRILAEEYGGNFDQEGKRLLGIVCENTIRMDQLITDLLNFSRVGRNAMKLCLVDLTALSISVYHELASPELQARIVFSAAPSPQAYCDSSLMKQVWRNLMSNALKFTAPMDVRTIEVGGHSDGGMNTYFIRDSGVGFNPVYAHKLFGVFQRLHKAEDFEGTGVGLAIVQRIIHRHGGKVWAEGKVGSGATFWFSLPNRQEEMGNRQ